MYHYKNRNPDIGQDGLTEEQRAVMIRAYEAKLTPEQRKLPPQSEGTQRYMLEVVQKDARR